MYVYLDPGQLDKLDEAVRVLSETSGVEEALPREEAAAKFRLYYDRIGDIVVTGEPDVVFGDGTIVREWGTGCTPQGLRSHASVHESSIPIIGYNGDFNGFTFNENLDIGRYVFERVLA